MSKLMNVNGELVNPEIYYDLKEAAEPVRLLHESKEAIHAAEEALEAAQPEILRASLEQRAEEEFSKNGESSMYRHYQEEIEKLKLEQQEAQQQKKTAGSVPSFRGANPSSAEQAERLKKQIADKSGSLAMHVKTQQWASGVGFRATEAGARVAAKQDAAAIKQLSSRLNELEKKNK